jgi:hypothetical protein
MPVPSAITDLSQTAGSNYPSGSDAPTTVDDHIRALASFIALLRDGRGLSTEVDVASAATCSIGAANAPCVRITGTTGITSFGATYGGPRFVRFGGVLTITHNASTLILPGGANITTAAGDTCIAVPIGNPASGWAVVEYQRAALAPGAASTATALATGRTIALTGDVTYTSPAFDGTGNVTAAATIPAGSLAFAKMLATDWSNSKTTNGYTKLPNGIYAQWGAVTATTSTSTQTVTFPTAFPTACLFVLTNPQIPGGPLADSGYWLVTSQSTTQFQTFYTASRSWLAIGY